MATDPKSKDQIFYLPLSERPPTKACTGLLDTYSHIPKDKLYSHIEAVRENAWNHYPYPSIGIWTFLDLGLSGNDLPKDDEERVQAYKTTYQSILSKLKNGGKFLDVGCMFAQDCRKLVFDGAPAESVYGTDLLGEYFEFGYELFNDTEVIPRDHFIAGDILAEKLPEGLEALKGKLDAIFNGQFLHVFSIEDQRKVGVRFVELLRPEKGVIVVGRCSGHVESGYRGGEHTKVTTKSTGDIWEHNPESFRQLWKDVAEKTGTQWDVKVWLCRFGVHNASFKEGWFREEGHGCLNFIITKL